MAGSPTFQFSLYCGFVRQGGGSLDVPIGGAWSPLHSAEFGRLLQVSFGLLTLSGKVFILHFRYGFIKECLFPCGKRWLKRPIFWCPFYVEVSNLSH